MLTHRNICYRHRQRDARSGQPVPRGIVHIAVPAAGAQLRPADPGRRGAGPGPHRPHRRTRANLVAIMQEFRPTFVLAVPRVFEKVYNTARQRAHADGKGAIFDRAERVAIAYSEALDSRPARGSCCGPSTASSTGWCTASCAPRWAGGARDAISGGAPLGARLAHFFRGIGVTVYEGYGLTETSPAAAVNLKRTHPYRHGRSAAARGDHPDRRRRRDRASTATSSSAATGATRRPPPRRSTPMAGSTPATWASSTTTATCRSPAGRRSSSSPPAARTSHRPCSRTGSGPTPLVSQCMVIGDRQPFIAALITIDEEAFPAWKEANGKPPTATVADLRNDPALTAEIQAAIDDANKAVSNGRIDPGFPDPAWRLHRGQRHADTVTEGEAHRGREGVRRRNRRNLSLIRHSIAARAPDPPGRGQQDRMGCPPGPARARRGAGPGHHPRPLGPDLGMLLAVAALPAWIPPYDGVLAPLGRLAEVLRDRARRQHDRRPRRAGRPPARCCRT